MNKVDIGGVTVGAGELVLIAGPCVIEDEAITFEILDTLVEITNELSIPLIFKASYDKANRTSIDSYRGPGIEEGLRILSAAKDRGGVPVITDVHTPADCAQVGEAVDCLQIPAYLCRQTDLLIEAGKTGRAVSIKKGQFMAPEAMAEAVKKVKSTGNENVFITERGTTFGYGNLVVDFRGIPVMRKDGTPVIFDATHSVQKPSAKGTSSGGDRTMIKYLARAAVATGIDGLFMEVHPRPDEAKSDGPNSIALKDLKEMLEGLKALDACTRGLS